MAKYVVLRDAAMVIVRQEIGKATGRGKRSISGVRLTLPNGDPGDQGAWRWRKTFCSKDGKVTKADPDKIKLALEDAARRAVRICEQEKIGTVRGTRGTGNDEWNTPIEYVEMARVVFGGMIDLDPATNEDAQQNICAQKYYTKETNSLLHEWHGRVWLNPPYSQPLIAEFISKLCLERARGHISDAICLTNNSTDTSWFHELVSVADAFCFTRGRLTFCNGPAGEPPQGQAFSYFGPHVGRFEEVFGQIGACLRPSRQASAEYDALDNIHKSVAEGFRAVRERVAAGGPGWRGHEPAPRLTPGDPGPIPAFLARKPGGTP
jgi:phage N-6-adenine-methyltransferase